MLDFGNLGKQGIRRDNRLVEDSRAAKMYSTEYVQGFVL